MGGCFQRIKVTMCLKFVVSAAYNKIIIAKKLMLRHSKTTQTLLTSISKLKTDSKQISSKLQQKILKNSEYLEDHIQPKKKLNMKILTSRQKSVDLLEKKLNHKRKMDEYGDIKLLQMEKTNERKKIELEKRIEQLNNRNLQRIREIKDIEQTVLKKINEDIQKNQMKQKHLQREYQRIRSEEKRVSETKIGQKKEAYDQWRVLQSQKWKLQVLAKNIQDKQEKLIKEKNPQPIRKEQKKKIEQKYIPTEKQYIKLKNPTSINPKEMGNQYLQQAKLMHRENQTKKNKKKLMNINLKVIGYTSDIMERIYRNTSDLSKFSQGFAIEKMIVPEDVLEKEGFQIKPQPITMEPSNFRIPDDYQTQKYIRQIKQNLSQIEKLNKNSINPEAYFNDPPQLSQSGKTSKKLQQSVK